MRRMRMTTRVGPSPRPPNRGDRKGYKGVEGEDEENEESEDDHPCGPLPSPAKSGRQEEDDSAVRGW